jgi:hypothetical protein
MNKAIKYPLPTVNFNGTDRETLLKDNVRILSAVADLREAINASTFHPRDYYVATVTEGNYGQAPYQEAREERAKHINKIADFAEYIEQHIEHLVDQNY